MKNITLFLSLILFLLIASSAYAQHNVNVSNTALYDGEQYLAVNPVNPNNIIIAYMSLRITGKIDIAVVVSSNGGQSFSNPQYMQHLFSSYTSADPCIAFKKTGEVYLCYVDYIPNSTDSGSIVLRKSSDGGLNWTNPSVVRNINETADLAIDRPWIHIDNSNGVFDGYIYVSSFPPKWASPLNQFLHIKFSSNSGLNWSQDIPVSTSGYPGFHGSMGMFASGNNTLYIAYLSLNGVNPSFALAKTTNNGLSFSRNHITNWISPGDTLIQMSYKLINNPLNGNELNFSYVNKFYNDADIFSIKSTNGGVNWSSPLRVNDDSVNNGKIQDMCWADWNGNYMGIGWRDKRNYNIGVWSPYDIYYATSTNGGSSFSVNHKMNLSSSGWNEYGIAGNDFLGFAISAGNVHMCWSSLIAGINWDIFYGRNMITSVRKIENNSSQEYFLKQNFPNPFNPQTTIEYNLPKSGFVSLKVFNILGKEVSSLVNEYQQPGKYSVIFKPADLNSGVYFYRLMSEDFKQIKRFVLIK